MALCVRALLLALCLIHGDVVLAQHTSLHVGMSKLSTVAALASMVAGADTENAEELEEEGEVEDKAEDEAETEENDVAEGAGEAEALLEESEEEEEGNQEEENMEDEEEEEEEEGSGEEDDKEEELAAPKSEDVMKDLDKNGDGKLSLTEVMTEHVPKETEESVTQAFNRFDHNKDNKIDSGELPALVKELHEKNLLESFLEEDEEDEGEEEDLETPEQIMKDLDLDKDGALSFTELVGKEDEANLMEQDSHSIKEVFEASDKNRDGKLDMQELPSALEEMDQRDL